jgi:hypothetical protein
LSVRLGLFEHIETFNFYTGEDVPIGVWWDFNFVASNQNIPFNAKIYLMDCMFDTRGYIGTFNTPVIAPDTSAAYTYNRPDTGNGYLVEFGSDVLIGQGNSVSGQVIEEDTTPGLSGASCNARLKFVW